MVVPWEMVLLPALGSGTEIMCHSLGVWPEVAGEETQLGRVLAAVGRAV